jgi:hypothetical protein
MSKTLIFPSKQHNVYKPVIYLQYCCAKFRVIVTAFLLEDVDGLSTSSVTVEDDNMEFAQVACSVNDSAARESNVGNSSDNISNGDWVAIELCSESNKTKKVYLGKVCDDFMVKCICLRTLDKNKTVIIFVKLLFCYSWFPVD